MPTEISPTSAPTYNEETRKAIEDVRNGIGLTKGYHSAAELFAALDAEEEKVSRPELAQFPNGKE